MPARTRRRSPIVGVLTEREIDGRRVRGFSVNFDKRYITLAPVATVVGLAFQAVDPIAARGRARTGHHLRADPGAHAGHGHRPAPPADELGLHERADPRQRCLRADGLGHRRRAAGRPGLAHADGKPGGRAARSRCRRWARRCSRRRCSWSTATAASASSSACRSASSTPSPSVIAGVARRPVRQRRGAPLHRCRARRRRAAQRRQRDPEGAADRGRPARRQRRHGHPRRQGHHPRPAQPARRGLPPCADRDHRRRREPADPRADHLRPGRGALPSAGAGRDDGGGGRSDARRAGPGAAGAWRPCAAQPAAQPGRRARDRPAAGRAARRGRAHRAAVGAVRPDRRPGDGPARRQAQAHGTVVGAAGRRAVGLYLAAACLWRYEVEGEPKMLPVARAAIAAAARARRAHPARAARQPAVAGRWPSSRRCCSAARGGCARWATARCWRWPSRCGPIRS